MIAFLVFIFQFRRSTRDILKISGPMVNNGMLMTHSNNVQEKEQRKLLEAPKIVKIIAIFFPPSTYFLASPLMVLLILRPSPTKDPLVFISRVSYILTIYPLISSYLILTLNIILTLIRITYDIRREIFKLIIASLEAASMAAFLASYLGVPYKTPWLASGNALFAIIDIYASFVTKSIMTIIVLIMLNIVAVAETLFLRHKPPLRQYALSAHFAILSMPFTSLLIKQFTNLIHVLSDLLITYIAHSQALQSRCLIMDIIDIFFNSASFNLYLTLILITTYTVLLMESMDIRIVTEPLERTVGYLKRRLASALSCHLPPRL